MLTHNARCTAHTSEPPDFVDLTDEIQAAVQDSEVTEGRVTILAPGDSCAILINERESGLLADIKATISRLGDGNGRSIVGAPSVVLPVVGGSLGLGTWQRILLVELESPSDRVVAVQITGEAGNGQGTT